MHSPSIPDVPFAPSCPGGPCMPWGPCGPGGPGMQQFPGVCICAINWAFVVIKLPFSAMSWALSAMSWAFWATNTSTVFNLFSMSWIIASSCWTFASSSAFVIWIKQKKNVSSEIFSKPEVSKKPAWIQIVNIILKKFNLAPVRLLNKFFFSLMQLPRFQLSWIFGASTFLIKSS